MNITKYILTKPSFEGVVTFGFSNENLLIYFINESNMNEGQQRWLLDHLPRSLQELQALRETMGAKLEVVPADISFEVFYAPFPNHRNRHRAEPLFTRLSDAHKTKAVVSVPAYVRYLKRTTIAAMLPENYLKRQEYLNNWDSL